MIEKIRGKYIGNLPSGIVVDVNGVGYGVETPLTTLARLPAKGEEVDLWTHTHVREDQLKLFGFLHQSERRVFDILLGLSGVGPKVALAILSTMSVDQIIRAVANERNEVFEQVPGIGKRSAEKILVEIKPKMKKLQAASLNEFGEQPKESAIAFSDSEEPGEDLSWAVFEDVRSALENLGFKEKSISEALKFLQSENVVAEFQHLMKEALQYLGRGIEKSFSGTDKKKNSKKSDTLDQVF